MPFRCSRHRRRSTSSRATRASPCIIGTTEGKTILALNNARKPFDDIRVRRALAYAIDRKALIDGAQSGYGKPIGSHYVPTDPGYVDLTGVYPYDPAKAKALLAEAGVKPGTEITIMLPPPTYARRGGEVIAAMLEQVGIKAKLVPIEWAQWLDQVFKQQRLRRHHHLAHRGARPRYLRARQILLQLPLARRTRRCTRSSSRRSTRRRSST